MPAHPRFFTPSHILGAAVFLAGALFVGAITLGPLLVAAPITPDEQVEAAVAPDEQVEAIVMPSLEDIDYLQWCLVAAQSELELDYFTNPDQREDIRFAREEMTEDDRIQMYRTLEALKAEQTPTIRFDITPPENTV